MEVKRRTASTLVSRLSSVSEQIRCESLSELRLMTKNDAESRSLIAETGAIPYLAETLYSSSHAAQEDAAATLLNLSISSREALMSTHGLLDAISHVLGHHNSSSSAAAVQSCAATLHSLLVVDEYRPVIGSKRDIIYSLVDILKFRKSPQRSIKDALKALFGIALCQPNRSTMVDLGVIPPLFSLVVVGSHAGIVEDASAVVAQVAGCEDSELAFRKVSGLGVLVDLLDSGTGSSQRTKENAVSALLNLARWGGERAEEDIKDLGSGILSEIGDVAMNGSEKGKAKAVELLKLIASGDIDGNVFEDLQLDRLINSCSE
ncbi:protein spotted leaf 11 [Cucurbita pepo subsp. pepo]|uniref:protein spotted leaf 11 n=1 Tax=Cucurbita pepo subsp. pepo TaxID=3664 RepID=UPI000C9D8C05|nr:protein spotted leaf 11 [Cucurbita pepo subsp. pepo]